MTPEEIRAEAIDRIARTEYDAWKVAYDHIIRDDPHEQPAPTYDAAPAGYGMKTGFQRSAARVVDALGDLLPTGRQWAARLTSPRGNITRLTSSRRDDIAMHSGPSIDGDPFVIEYQWTHEWKEEPW